MKEYFDKKYFSKYQNIFWLTLGIGFRRSKNQPQNCSQTKLGLAPNGCFPCLKLPIFLPLKHPNWSWARVPNLCISRFFLAGRFLKSKLIFLSLICIIGLLAWVLHSRTFCVISFHFFLHWFFKIDQSQSQRNFNRQSKLVSSIS